MIVSRDFENKTRQRAVGGEGGIRTPETFKGFTRFPGVRLKPLGHLSKRELNSIGKKNPCHLE